MPHQIFQDCKGRRLDIDIAPINPAVSGAKCGAEQPVSGLGHALSSACLSGETVSTLDILVDLLAKVLLDDGDLAKGYLWAFTFLQVGQQIRKKVEGVVLGVTDEEGQVNEVMRIGQVAQVRKEHGQMRRGVSQRSTK